MTPAASLLRRTPGTAVPQPAAKLKANSPRPCSRLPEASFPLRFGCLSARSRRPVFVKASSSDASKPIEPRITPSKQGEFQTDTLLPVFKYGLVATGLAQLFVPEKFAEVFCGTTPLTYSQQLLQTMAPFLLLAAACFHVLQGAAEHDRLKSDTYQRLTITTLAWYTGIVALFLARRGFNTAGWVLAATGVACIATTWRAYTRDGSRSVVEAVNDAFEGLGASFKHLVKCSTWNSGLWAAASTAFGLIGLKLLIIVRGQQLGGVGGFLLGASPSQLPQLLVQMLGVHLLLASSVSFTLKDAVERDRINASTFQALAKTLAAVAVVALVGLFRLAPAALNSSPETTALFRGLQVLLGAVGVLSLVNVNLGEK